MNNYLMHLKVHVQDFRQPTMQVNTQVMWKYFCEKEQQNKKSLTQSWVQPIAATKPQE